MLAVTFAALCLSVSAPETVPDGAVGIVAQITDILNSEALSGARTGVYVKRIEDNQPLYSQSADTLFIPASNVKIVTSASALHHFGPDYRFKTEVYLLSPNNSTQKGVLAIRGYGDPSLVPERLWYLASRVYFSGVREVDGIIIDDSYFDGPRMANGWEQDRSDNAYMAPTGAVSVGFNALLIHVLPGTAAGTSARVLIDPVSDYTTVEANVITVSRGRTSLSVEVTPTNEHDQVRLSGRIHINDPGRALWRRIDNPPLAAGEMLKTMLQQQGVKVRGKIRQGTIAENAMRIATVTSPRLAEIVTSLNKSSNNFMAEQIALALGAARFGPPATWDKAQAAFDDFLTHEIGLAPGTYTLRNGSGLHDVNRMTPRQLVAVLEYMRKNPQLSPEFTTSLAVAGSSGTLVERMKSTEAARLLRAKTGTLSNASALSGYVTTRSGSTLAFSIIVNDYRVPVSDVWRVQDQLGAALASLDLSSLPPITTLSRRTVSNDAKAAAP